MKTPGDHSINRRDICRGALRWLALCGVGGAAAVLVVRDARHASDDCRRTHCGECAALAGCELPQALSARNGQRS